VIVLVDTHYALWMATGGDALTEPEKALIFADEVEILISAVSLWELRLKWDSYHVSGTRKGPADPNRVLATLIDAKIRIMPLDAAHAATSLVEPIPHKDPFDELLLIQAQETGAKFLTRDRRLLDHSLVVAP